MKVGEEFIVKIQMPLESSEPIPRALIYNRDRSILIFRPIEDVKDMMDGEVKKFFFLQIINEKEVALREAPWQEW